MPAPTVACCCPSMPRKWPACWFTRKQAINRAGTRATSKGPKLRTAGGMTAARDRPQSGYTKKSKQVENGEVCFELARGEKETKFHPFSWQPFGFHSSSPEHTAHDKPSKSRVSAAHVDGTTFCAETRSPGKIQP